MKRILIAIVCFVLGFGVAQAIVAPPAEAAVGGVRVQNVGVTTFKIFCDYGSSHYETLSSGQNSQQSGKCTAENYDTDQVLVTTTRCVKFVGPVKADGYYRLQPSIRAKVPDLSTFAVHPLDFCSGRGSAYKGYWTYR